jgi:hypothetical protein
MARPSSTQDPAPLGDRLRARRGELEQETLARIAAIADPGAADPAYLTGLRAALTAALDYGLAAIGAPEREPKPVPVQLLTQARLAARSGVSLEAVLRRYAAGHSLLADTLLDEAAAVGIGAAELKPALSGLAGRYDRVVAAVSEEYERARESDAEPRSPERRRYGLLCRLLRGERLDLGELGYDFDGHHLALVASGATAAEALAGLGDHFDRRLLLAEPDEQSAWAWLGGRQPFDERDIESLASVKWPERVAVGCGVAGKGLGGWRLTHRQAVASLSVAERVPQALVHYADAALLASALHDDLLLTSLDQLYIAPLSAERDQGSTAKETLRAYLAAAGNASSAAAALGVNRRTVASRLAAIEERLGRSVDAAAAEIETALRLDEVGAFSA